MININKNSPPSLWGSCRLNFAICAFVTLTLDITMRNSISFAILYMVKPRIHFGSGRNISLEISQEHKQCNIDGNLGKENTRLYSAHAEFDWSRHEEKELFSSFYLGYFITQALLSQLSGLSNGKICLIIGITGQSLSFMLIPMFSRINVYAAAVIRIIQGIFAHAEFDWSRQDEGQLLASFYFGYLITQAIAGRLSGRYGGKLFLIIGTAGQAVVFMSIPLFAKLSVSSTKIVRAIQGTVAGFGSPSIYQMFSVWSHPTERVALVTFAYSGFATGALVSFPLTSFLCTLAWSSVFYVIGGISFVFGIMCFWLIYNSIDQHPRISIQEHTFLKEGGSAQTKSPNIPWRKILTSCPIHAFIFTHICHSFGLILLVLYLPQFLRETMYFKLSENGIYSATPFVGCLIARVLVIFTFQPLFARCKMGLTSFRRMVLIIANTISIFLIIIVTILTCGQRYWVILMIALIGIVLDIGFTAGYWVSCLDMAPAFAGLISGLANSLSTLSGILLPYIVSEFLHENTKKEWNKVFYLMAAANAVSVLVYGFFGSSEPQAWGQFPPKDQSVE